jgi:hypothetical protein
MTLASYYDSCAGVEVKEEEEEEETLGQLRDRQVLAAARAAVTGPRAPFVHIKVEDSSSGQDTDKEGGEGGGEEATGWEVDGQGEEEEEEEEQEEEEEEDEEEDWRRRRRRRRGGSAVPASGDA